MVHSQLHVEAVLRLPRRTPHDSGVVYQNVHALLLCNKKAGLLETLSHVSSVWFGVFCTLIDSFCELSDGLHGGKVQLARINMRVQRLPSDLLRCRFAFLHVAASHNDPAP